MSPSEFSPPAWQKERSAVLAESKKSGPPRLCQAGWKGKAYWGIVREIHHDKTKWFSLAAGVQSYDDDNSRAGTAIPGRRLAALSPCPWSPFFPSPVGETTPFVAKRECPSTLGEAFFPSSWEFRQQNILLLRIRMIQHTHTLTDNSMDWILCTRWRAMLTSELHFPLFRIASLYFPLSGEDGCHFSVLRSKYQNY